MCTKEEILKLSENYGTLDLLTAYLMRTRNYYYEKADHYAYDIDTVIERILDKYEEEK